MRLGVHGTIGVTVAAGHGARNVLHGARELIKDDVLIGSGLLDRWAVAKIVSVS